MAFNRKTASRVGLVNGFRSGLEDRNAALLADHSVKVEYEEYKLSYTKPARSSTYTPDFVLPNGIVIETKGRFVTADRQKHKLILEQHPLLDIRFVFSNSKSRISKTSKTTYAKWCDHLGLKYADKLIPITWITEPADPKVIVATIDALGWSPPTKGIK